ncbi:MAG: response regulator [Gammaproteobacteria bacterium]|nr:response regulator [Gammaproteobacteria bacterium]
MAAAPDQADATIAPLVLALDDDPDIRALLETFLPDYELRVRAVGTGTAMLEILHSEPVDVLLLDLRLPGEDGMSIARQVRERSMVPIIIVSGRRDEADRVMGLELAADDYVTKPFSPRELVARIRAVIRRAQQQVVTAHDEALRAYRFSGWELNLRTRRLTNPAGQCVELTNGEFNLLCAFLSAPEAVLTRDQLLERSRLHNLEVYDRAIDVTILRLRRKLERDASNPRLIVTERGAGYRFAVPVSILR